MRHRSSAGFTLTEILVVLTVFGIVMIAAIPNMHRANQTQRLNQSISHVETALRRARSIAATDRIPVRVRFDAASRDLFLEADPDEDGSFARSLGEFEIDRDIQVEDIGFGDDDTIVFDERGAPDDPGSVILRTRDGAGREVLVSAGSGSVTVFEADPVPED